MNTQHTYPLSNSILPKKKTSEQFIQKICPLVLPMNNFESEQTQTTETFSCTDSDSVSDESDAIYSIELGSNKRDCNPKYWKTWEQMTQQERVDSLFPAEKKSAKERADLELDQYQELYQETLNSILQNQMTQAPDKMKELVNRMKFY